MLTVKLCEDLITLGSQVGNSSLKSLNGLKGVSNNWYGSIKALEHHGLWVTSALSVAGSVVSHSEEHQ